MSGAVFLVLAMVGELQMEFELNIALQRFVLPGLCSLIGCILLVRTDPDENCYENQPLSGIGLPTVVGSFLCAVGLVGSDLWNRGLIANPSIWYQWKASYQWNWLVWMVPTAMMVLAIARTLFSTPVRFPSVASTLIFGIAIGMLFVCLNEGQIWADQASKLLQWMAAGSLAAIWNIGSLNAIGKSGGARWNSFVVLAQLGCLAAITLQAYGSLGELALVGIAIAFSASIVGLIKGSQARLDFGWPLSTVVLPLAILAVSLLVVSRFFESVPLPSMLVGSVLFLPTIVGTVDLVLGRLTYERLRPCLAATICIGILGTIIYFAISVKPEW